MQYDQLKRRAFIMLLGGAVAWPLAARAQQPAMPAIGFFASGSADKDASRVRGFHQVLSETGYLEARHVVHASTERDFDSVFATLIRVGAGALVIEPDALFH
jgi:hypothetical protein